MSYQILEIRDIPGYLRERGRWDVSFATSDFGMGPAQRKALIAESVSPQLCKITEDVVLSEPYVEHEHNHRHPALTELARGIRSDAQLRTEVAALRHTFMTSAQALLHGDLPSARELIVRRNELGSVPDARNLVEGLMK